MNNFKVGGYVRTNKNSSNDVKNYWSEEMKVMFDGKYRRILTVKNHEFMPNKKVLLGIEGIKNFPEKDGLWTFCFEDLDYITKEEYEKLSKIKEKQRFKVGDWVNGAYFDDVKQVEDIDNSREFCTVKIEGTWYNPEFLTLVCGFVNGEEIELSHDGKYWHRGFEQKFHSYEPTLEKPFIVVRSDGYVENCKYAKAIEPKYKPYTEPKLEWIGQEIKHIIFGYTVEIEAVGKNCVILADGDIHYYKRLLENFIWAKNGSPCGEKTC